jgi:electron transfer flavoprotein alpha/beta subunit
MAIFKKHIKSTTVQPSQKKVIDKAVKKVVKEYGETLVLLGKE